MLIEYKDRHMLPDEEAVVLFDSITCTGGTTLSLMLGSHFGKKLITTQIYAPITFHANPRMENFSCFVGHGVRHAHQLLPEWRKMFYITLLRHPFQWFLSLYRHANMKIAPEKAKRLEWYIYNVSCYDNFITNWLGNGNSGRAEEVLFERYAFFGITEFYAESVYGLGEFLPWLRGRTTPPATASKPDERPISKLAEEYFLEKNAKDIDLYGKAVKEFKKRFPGQPGGDDKVVESLQKNIRNVSVIRSDAYNQFLDELYRLPDGLMPDIGCGVLFDKGLFSLLSFLYTLETRNYEKANIYGNATFNILDEIDVGNKLDALTILRMMMIEHLSSSPFGCIPGTFFERCLICLSALRETRQWSAKASYFEAVLLQKHGRFNAALDSARNAVLADPGNPTFHDALSSLLVETDACDEAEVTARSELARNPDCEWALRRLALALSAKGDGKGAELFLGRTLRKNPYWGAGILLLPNFPDLLADDYFFSTAENFARENLSMNPDGAYMWNDFLLRLFTAAGKVEEAIAEARRMMENAPEYVHHHISLSRVFEARGEVDNAVAEIRMAIERMPGYVSFREMYTMLLLRHNRIDEAEKDARESMAAFPGLGWPLLQLSRVCEARGKIAEGLEYARKAYALQPEKWTLAANLAHFLRVSGNDAEFENFCEKALERDSRQGWVWRERCRMAESRGDRARALKMGRMAFQVHPGNAFHPEDRDFREYYNVLAHGAAFA